MMPSSCLHADRLNGKTQPHPCVFRALCEKDLFLKVTAEVVKVMVCRQLPVRSERGKSFCLVKEPAKAKLINLTYVAFVTNLIPTHRTQYQKFYFHVCASPL